MATAMKKTNVKSSTVEENTVIEQENEAVNEVVEETPVKEKKQKKFEATEGIPCRSITSGGLYMEGIKSHIVYEWADNGDVTEVEYQDLVAAIRSNVSYISKPYFVIEDKEVLEQFPQVKKRYESMYSIRDLRDVLTDLPVQTMKATILSLPEGARESIKHLASQMISNGSLDSVQKIKTLDEIYGTELMLMTGLFS